MIDRRGAGLLVAIAISLATAATAFSAEPSGMDRPMNVVQADLGRRLACEWEGADNPFVCQSMGVMALGLYKASDDTVESVRMLLTIANYPQRNHRAERRSQDTAIEIVRYFLPTWREGPRWLRRSLADAIHPHSKHVTKVGAITILVQRHQFADVEDIDANIVLTKKASTGEWEDPVY